MWKFLENVSEPAKKKAKTRDEKLAVQRKYEVKRERTFQESWLKDFTWLIYDKSENSMSCSICKKFDTTGTFVNGCTNLRIQSIRIHNESEGHLRCVGMAEKKSSNSEGQRSLKMLNSAAHSKLRHLFMNAHFVAKCGRPYTDYVQICKLDKAKGLDVGNTYLTDKSCQVFISAIADTLRIQQNAIFKSSPFISIISDGSTDTSSQEAEIVLVRSSVNGNVYTHFMGLKNVSKADSTHISNAIFDILTDRYGEGWKAKVIGVGTDGASVMLGKKSGVVVKIREHTNRPFIYGIHCSAHRLELAYKDAVKCLKDKWTTHQKCEALLLNLYLFYKLSPLNRSNLKASFDSLGQKVLLPTRVGGTRWLPHTRMALKHLIHGHAAIIQHLEQMQNPSDATHRKESAAKGKNFLKLLKDRRIMVWLHLLMDIVSCLSTVSEAIQEANISLSDVWNEIESAKNILKKYKTNDGPYLRKVTASDDASEISTESSRECFLSAIISSIDVRFEGDLHLFKGSYFISFKNWPEELNEDLADFGDTDIADLISVCGPALSLSQEPGAIEVEEIESEWTRFKTDVYSSKKNTIRSLSWSTLWGSSAEKYPNLFGLVSYLLTLPSSSVDAERGFSRMKILKSDWRSCLSDSHLSDQLLISSEGEAVGEFDPDPAVAHWESISARQRRPFFNDTLKPKNASLKTDNQAVEEIKEVVDYDHLMDCLATYDDDFEMEEGNRDLLQMQNKAYKLLLDLM